LSSLRLLIVEADMTEQSRLDRRSVLALGGSFLPGAVLAAGTGGALQPSPAPPSDKIETTYGRKQVGDVSVFYREAGRPDAPVILLLHGFPTAGHMFRDLIPALADRYRVIAPDLPGFGNTVAPSRASFQYSFDKLADVIEGFVEALKLTRYALYIFDYGAPTGLRLAMKHPERVSAIITQKGSARSGGRGKPIGRIRPPRTASGAARR
jgi:pimeloyl-ACP methyl ester carboxylesterase